MIELIITILVGSILTSVALASFSNSQGRFAVRGAKTTYAAFHARARATSIELGRNVRLFVDLAGDSAWLYNPADSTTIDRIEFGGELSVDLRASVTRINLCMSPRGYADSNCGNISTPTRLEFWQNADSTSLVILPLGQLVGM